MFTHKPSQINELLLWPLRSWLMVLCLLTDGHQNILLPSPHHCPSSTHPLPLCRWDTHPRIHNFQTWLLQQYFIWPPLHHITPILQHLHWLPIKQRIQFKILLITYKTLNNLAQHTWKTFSINTPLPAASDQLMLTSSPPFPPPSTEPLPLLQLPSGTHSPYISETQAHSTFKNKHKTNLFSIAFNI